jgi:uncharacterized membrane protein
MHVMEMLMTTMLRTTLAVTVLLLASSTAYAQAREAPPASCWAVALKGQVVVTMNDGSEQKGTLACLGSTEVVLAGSGSIPIDSILRIDKPRDGILDGVLKGASVGLVMLALCAPHCSGEGVLRVTAAYAVFGGILDAAQGNNPTIFRRGTASPSLAWRIRF